MKTAPNTENKFIKYRKIEFQDCFLYQKSSIKNAHFPFEKLIHHNTTSGHYQQHTHLTSMHLK